MYFAFPDLELYYMKVIKEKVNFYPQKYSSYHLFNKDYKYPKYQLV